MSLSPVAVILIAAFMCIAAIVGCVWLAERLDPPRGRHTPFADPADRTDPDGEQYIARLSADEKPPPDLDDDPADITGIQPAATRYLGKPLGQYIDELFDKHAEAKQ